jgi:hypothetical protein
VIDAFAFQLLPMVLTDWLARREREVVAYLIEENRCLRRQLGTRRVRLTDDDRRRLAARAYRIGRRARVHRYSITCGTSQFAVSNSHNLSR